MDKIEKKKYLLLEEKNIFKSFIILATPVLLVNIFKSLNDFVDTYFVGHIENSGIAQASMSVAWPLLNIFIAFGLGLGVAGVSIIGQCLGAKNEKLARKYTTILMIFSIILGIVVNLVLYFFSPLLLPLFGKDKGVIDIAISYIRIRSFEMPCYFIFVAYQAARQAKGDTTTPVVVSSLTIIINILLTWLFVDKYNMGAYGAGLATFIGQLFIVPICIILISIRKDEIYIDLKDLKFNKEQVKTIIKLATPSAFAQAFANLGFFIIQLNVLNEFQNVTSAAFSNGNKISNFLLMPTFAIGSVLAAFIGQNVGARNKDRAIKGFFVGTIIGLVVSVLGIIILFPIRKPLLSLLTNDPEVLDISIEYIFWVLITQPFLGLFQNYTAVFNGTGNTHYSFIMTAARLWIIRLPMIWVMEHFAIFEPLGRSIIWYAMDISNVLILIVGHILYKRVNFEPKVKTKDEGELSYE